MRLTQLISSYIYIFEIIVGLNKSYPFFRSSWTNIINNNNNKSSNSPAEILLASLQYHILQHLRAKNDHLNSTHVASQSAMIIIPFYGQFLN